MYLKFPEDNYLSIPAVLKGKGVPGIADIGTFEPFFSWRDRLYANFCKSLYPYGDHSSSSGTASINID
jgi:glutathione S-transferase